MTKDFVTSIFLLQHIFIIIIHEFKKFLWIIFPLEEKFKLLFMNLEVYVN